MAYFRSPGPRLGLPKTWTKNQGISPSQFPKLAAKEGLKSILTPAGDLTSQHLEVFLRNNGPVWSAGRWYGFPHIVVLTGIDGDTVYINDPDGPRAKSGSVAWFNEKLARDVTPCLMYMPK